MNRNIKLTTFEIVLFGVLGALTFAAKFVMSSLPNIEPVSLMIMLFAVTFGWKALYPTFLYVAMEILFYGINVWNIYYLYIWAVLLVAAVLMRKMEEPLGWAILSGTFGLLFGVLCAPVLIFLLNYTVEQAIIMGVAFDIVHAVGNLVAGILVLPMSGLLFRLEARAKR